MELGSHIEALRRDPTSGEAAEAVRAGARETGAFRAYAEAFAERGESLMARGEREAAVEAWVEAALVCEENVGDLARAAQLYERALELDPTHRRALFALGLVLFDLQRWDALVALYRRRIELTPDEGERTTLLQYVAELLAEKKDDPHGAFEALLAAATCAPRNVRNLSRLQKLGEVTGRLPEVAIAVGDVLMHQEDPHLRAALGLRLAEMYLGPLDEPQRALAHLRGALADDGGNPDVLEEIEDVFRERARFDELAAFLEEVIDDRRIRPHRVRLERELARLYEHELDDLSQALRALTRALEVLPEDRELLDEVMRLGLMEGDLDAVAAIYERVVTVSENPLLVTYLRLKLGHIYANVLERPEDARRIYSAILDAEPGHEEARRRLARLDDASRRGPPAPRPSRAGAPRAPRRGEEEAAPPTEAGRGVSDAVDEALALVAEVERLRGAGDEGGTRPREPEGDDPAPPEDGPPQARGTRPEGLGPRSEAPDPPSLATVPAPHSDNGVVVRLGLQPPPAGAPALGEPRGGSEPSTEASEPSAPEGASRATVLPLVPPTRPGSPARRPAPAEPPEQLEARVEGLEGDERTEMRLRAAAAWAAAGDDGRAERLLREGLREHADEPRLLTALGERLEARGAWGDWMEVGARRWAGGPDPSLALRLAEVADRELGDPDEAWLWARRALEADPGEEAPLRLLERLARDAEDLAALAEVLEARARWRPDDPEIGLAAGRAWLDLGLVHRGLAVLASARAASPQHPGLLATRAEALEEEGALDEAEAAWAELRTLGSPEARTRAELRWAALAARRPASVEAAREAVSRILEAEPDRAEARALACDLHLRGGDPAAALEHAEAAAQLEAQPAAAAAWWRRAASLAAEALGDTGRAAASLTRAVELDPDDPEASARLGDLLLARGEVRAAASRLLAAARAVRDEARAAELFEAAGGALEQAGEPAEARQAYEAALEEAPDRPRALERAMELYARTGALDAAHDRAVHLLLHHEASLPPQTRAACFVHMARHKADAREPAAAARLAQRALACRAEDEDALSLLAEARAALGANEEAVEALRALAALRPGGPRRAAVLLHAARLLSAQRARRRALLEEAFLDAPEDPEVGEALARARLAMEDRPGAAEAFEAAATHAAPEAAALLWLEAAEAGGEVAAADVTRRRLEHAAAQDPPHPAAVEALDTHLAQLGHHLARVEALRAAADRSAPPHRAKWREQASLLAETRLEDPSLALELAPAVDEARRADLLFRAALESARPGVTGGAALAPALRVWATRLARAPGDRLALARLAELFFAAGAPARGRFVLELGAVTSGAELEEGLPPPEAPPEAIALPVDPEERGPETPLLELLGHAPLRALPDELPAPRPRARDALGPAALGVRVDRPLREAATALGMAPPPVFPAPPGELVRPAFGPSGPCLLVAPEPLAAAEPASARFLLARALAELRPGVLALGLLPAEVLRSVALGLAELAPAPGDAVSRRVARRRARAVERCLEPSARGAVAEAARAWLASPARRSLTVARRAARRTADRAGLLASGSPLAAWAEVGEDRPLDRARLLRFAHEPLALGVEPPPSAGRDTAT